MFALRVAFGEVWTGAGWDVADGDFVDVTCAAGEIDGLGRATMMRPGTVFIGSTFAIECEEALSHGAFIVAVV